MKKRGNVVFNNVFTLAYKNCTPNETLSLFLQEKTSQDIIEFGIPHLPEQLKIEIEVISHDSFLKKLSETSLPCPIQHFCITYSDSFIHCIDYAAIYKQVSVEKYLKSIRHECIHILQHLATLIAPQSAVWLYESIACARAEQKTATPTKIPSWDDFVTKFYAQPDCYALAYTFGINLLNHTSLNMLAKQCENFDFFTKECEKIYSKIFNK